MVDVFYHSNLWKTALDNIMRKNIKPGHKAVIVGAQLDESVLLITKLVGPTGKVFSFEPDAVLEKNKIVTSSVVIDAGNPVVADDNKQKEDLIVVTKTKLSDLVRPPINFLRMEVQGGETIVVRGARNLIVDSPELLVLTQFWPYGLMRMCKDDGNELLTFFANNGFHLYIMEKGSVNPHSVTVTDLLGAFKPDKDEFCYLLLTRGVL